MPGRAPVDPGDAIHWLSPGDPARRTGGFLYNARMVEELQKLGRTVHVHRIDADWPLPASAPDLPALPTGARVVADGLLLTGVRAAMTARPDLRVSALVHSPLWREGGDRVERLRALEQVALRRCAQVIATSEQTAQEVAADIGGPVSVVVPGTEPAAPVAPGPGHRLLCPAHLLPRKGHLDLLAALARLADRTWTLTLVGSDTVAPATTRAVQAAADSLGDRVHLRGEVDAAGMDAALHQADLVVLPSHYEAFGMVLTEAVARGLPVLATPAGALPLLGDAAMAVPAHDPPALAEALAAWLDQPEQRTRRRDAAARVAPTLPRWARQAALLDRILAER